MCYNRVGFMLADGYRPFILRPSLRNVYFSKTDERDVGAPGDLLSEAKTPPCGVRQQRAWRLRRSSIVVYFLSSYVDSACADPARAVTFRRG
jgi:hypothetical protein